MNTALSALVNERPAFYYDLLCNRASRVAMWQTEYLQSVESHAAIIEFIRGTGLRPFLEALDDDAERAEFVKQLTNRVAQDYGIRADGRVLFPFRRFFFIAYR
jgi:trans-aconitate 2-methyltransferase